jgi:hypothetical protein
MKTYNSLHNMQNVTLLIILRLKHVSLNEILKF